jgi:hypothetical protein
MIPILIAAAAAAAATPAVTPPANTTCRTSASPHIIVQGGSPVHSGGDPRTIGPKQDDPVRHSAGSPGGNNATPAIGPKQDDPVGGGGRGGTTLRSGTGGGDPRAIGPKQDDPVQPRPGACAVPAAAG